MKNVKAKTSKMFMCEVIEQALQKRGNEARKQGLKQGREEGIKEATSQAILKLLSQGMSKDFILDLGYSKQEI